MLTRIPIESYNENNKPGCEAFRKDASTPFFRQPAQLGLKRKKGLTANG
jgi:hypothetical protein